MTSDPARVARASYDAYVRKDRPAIEALIARDFRFTSPLDNGLDRETYFKRCWPNSEFITGFNFIRMTGNGDEVLVTYEALTKTGSKFRNTEILTVRNGLLTNVEVYFGWSIPHEAPLGGFIDKPGA